MLYVSGHLVAYEYENCYTVIYIGLEKEDENRAW